MSLSVASRALLLALSALLPASATSQSVSQSLTPGNAIADYARLLQLSDSFSSDPWNAARAARSSRLRAERGLQLELLPMELRGAWNSRRPWGTNDGALWQGRGATGAFTAGAAFRWGPLSGALRPTVIRNENRGFDLSPLAGSPGLGPWSYPSGIGQTLDMPQRFGDGSFDTFDLGQSFVRADLGPVAVGISNESQWWGPARRNAIAMTNNAPGFGHAYLGTSRPADIRIGKFETRWLWGRLRESGYFDADASNDSRYFTGIVATFSPKGVPDLQLGATRTFLSAWSEGGPSFDEVLLVVNPLQKKRLATPENPSGNDATDQMASLFFRWAMPRAGFELYGEWGRGDHSWDLHDLMTQPEHASAWMLGMQKSIDPTTERIWRFAAELTILGSSRTTLVRPPASGFYQHHIIKQGYTQRGQVMGAGIGPGSSQASVGVDRFAKWGKVGAAFQRTVYDNNRFYAEPRLWDTNEAEPAFTVDALVFRGPWDVEASVATANLLNKHYQRRSDERNLNVNLSLRYHFGSR